MAQLASRVLRRRPQALSSRVPSLASVAISRRQQQQQQQQQQMSTNVPPRDWKSAAPRPGPSGSATFGAQDNLPRLPVPKLDQTLAKLDKSLQALAWNSQELHDAQAKIRKFGEGIGPVLQERLEKHASDPKKVNWLEEWWDDGAYLTYRDSVVVNVSYYYGFIDAPANFPKTPVHRAASVTRSALLWRKALKQGQIPHDRVKDGAHCMDSFRWMFDCSRIPGQDGKDFSVSHAEANDSGDSGSVIFIRRGRVWKVDAVVDGRLISTAELEKQLEQIYEKSKSKFPQVGYLVANNRDVWAKDYALLAQESRNQQILDAINSSAFVVSLDEERPDIYADFSRAAWHGGVAGGSMGTRWVDKPVQFIVFDNAKAAIMGEHSVMDGTPVARMAGEVIEALKSSSFDHGPSAVSAAAPAPVALDWVISPTIETSIQRAKDASDALVNSQSLNYLRTSYGKATVKKLGFSPDSYTQMIIQLAYHRLLLSGAGASGNSPSALLGEGVRKAARNGGTYEAATTRKFAHGRTEAIRVTSVESEAFCAAVVGWSEGRVSKEDVRAKFDAAVKTHGADARAAGNGQGVDRHFFGLKRMLTAEDEAPALFSDQLFQRSSKWILSTSAIHHPNFDVYGWGEVVPDGFGVPYVAGQDDYLQFTVTSRKELPNAEFAAELDKASEDMLTLFGNESRPEKAKL